jgi:hypothetical protein
LLWLPRIVAFLGGIPGAEDGGHTALSVSALLVGGLAPLWVAAGWAKLRGRTLPGMLRLLRESGWLGRRALRFAILAPTVTLFFGNFALWKSAIPLVYPGFIWDERLEHADVLLHGGYPDRLLAGLAGSPAAIVFLDRAYHVWFYVLFAVVIWQAWEADDRRAFQFWTTFALAWIGLGILTATAFASAGPIFAAEQGNLGYSPLVLRLHEAATREPLYVHLSARMLWEAAREPGVRLGDGISAFPSLHVSFVTIATLVAWRAHRVLGIAAGAYAIIIFVASIMLGWHYAVDGEAAILATCAIWLFVGRWMNRPGTRASS